MLAIAGALAVASGTAGAATQDHDVRRERGRQSQLPGELRSRWLSAATTVRRRRPARRTSPCAARTRRRTQWRSSTGGGTFAQRLLSGSGANTLQYNLFTTVAAATIWGDGTLGTGMSSGMGAGMAAASAQTHTVFGVLPDNAFNQGAPSGNYSDTITVTVTY